MELFCDRLHGLGVETAWLPKHGKRVAADRPVGEAVDEPVVVASHLFDTIQSSRRGAETLSTRQGPPGLRPVPHRAGALGAASGPIISVSPFICVLLLGA